MNGLEVVSRLKLAFVLKIGRVRSCWLALSVENFSDCLVAINSDIVSSVHKLDLLLNDKFL